MPNFYRGLPFRGNILFSCLTSFRDVTTHVVHGHVCRKGGSSMFRIILSCFIMSVLPVTAPSVQAEGGENRIHNQVQKKLASGEKSNRLFRFYLQDAGD